MGTATMPGRIKKVSATADEESMAYLKPYDVFEYLPPETDRISKSRTKNFDSYVIRIGDILQTRSGRNLGPVTIADDYLARFTVSDDMVRVRIPDEAERLYTFAFLRSATGQRSLRGERGGSVINHISPEHVADISVPFVDAIEGSVVDKVREAVDLRGNARSILHQALEATNKRFPAPRSGSAPRWTVSSQQLWNRLDAAFHSNRVTEAKAMISDGVELGDVADVIKPGGRHRMIYVDRGRGTPLLSGRQILQADVVAAKELSKHSAQTATDFGLTAGSVIFQADGRAGAGLGYPSVVTAERNGWFASGHVGRLVPLDGCDVGWLWTAFASDVVQTQVQALCCGSVVDALYPEDLERIVLPPQSAVDSMGVKQAWDDLAEATVLLDQATRSIDDHLLGEAGD
ncbi:hypothetical protein GS439_09035 [Rhodococcus hoagii]|nr:hypothetical protein [Prescottella equi]